VSAAPRIRGPDAGRWVDPAASVCAQKLGGWAPIDLVLNGPAEAARDRAEAHRLAYVAATRARDVLVIPAVGDGPYEGGWLEALMPAIYPAESSRRSAGRAPGCPVFTSKDSVLRRPDGDPAGRHTVAPGLHDVGGTPVVWWDPHVLQLDKQAEGGLRQHFLLQADDKAKRRTVMCFGRADGKLLWQSGVSYSQPESTHPDNPYCSGTPATDGERVVACFGSAGLYCYDFAGKELWHRDLGKLNHMFGNAISPVIVVTQPPDRLRAPDRYAIVNAVLAERYHMVGGVKVGRLIRAVYALGR